MKRSLLIILTAILANVLSAQPYVEISPASAQVTVNATNPAGVNVAFNVKYSKEISILDASNNIVSFYSSVGFRVDVPNSSLVTTGSQGTFTVAPDNTIKSGLKVVTVNIPSTALSGQIFVLNIAVTDGGITTTGSAAITVAQVLPITWSSFEAVQKEKNIALSWTTESEKENSHFVVERSTNGTEFSSIGEVKAVGNSNTTNKYQFEDTEARNSVNYYRIRAISLEGISDISKVVSVVKKGSFDAKTFLTAQGARVQISADQIGEEATLQVINLNGQVVSSKQIKIDASLTDTEIDFQEKGIFIINIKTDTQSISKKLLKY